MGEDGERWEGDGGAKERICRSSEYLFQTPPWFLMRGRISHGIKRADPFLFFCISRRLRFFRNNFKVGEKRLGNQAKVIKYKN